MDPGNRKRETDDGRRGPPKWQGEEDDGPVRHDDRPGVHLAWKSASVLLTY